MFNLIYYKLPCDFDDANDGPVMEYLISKFPMFFFTHLRYNKTVIEQQFRLTLDLLCKEDLNVGLSFALSNTEIFLAQ